MERVRTYVLDIQIYTGQKLIFLQTGSLMILKWNCSFNLESVATFDWLVVLLRGICQILMQFVKRSAQQAMCTKFCKTHRD